MKRLTRLFLTLTSLVVLVALAATISDRYNLLTSHAQSSVRYDDLPDMAEYVVEGRKWDHTNLTYFFQNGTSDIGGDGERQAVRDAFALWAGVTSLTFTEVSNAVSADIVILWGAGNHGDPYPFDGVNGVLAHAFFPPPNGDSLAGDAHFDDAETWTLSVRPDSSQPIDLVTVAAHEIGHSLGLGHSQVQGALMYAFYGGSHRFLDPDDINGIRAVYPPVGAYVISGQVTNGVGVGLGSVIMSLNGSQSASVQTDGSGNYSFTNLAAGGSYTVTPLPSGYTFNPPQRTYTNLNANQTGQNFTGTPTAPVETVWVEDAMPTGALGAGEETWNWVSTAPAPFSGAAAHQSALAAGMHQHYFIGSTQTLTINAGDVLVTYVYLDPANPPSQLMLQWTTNGSIWHRAYWGANLIEFGVDGTNSRRYMGPLPATGQWVRLEVPASAVGLEGLTLNGMAFTLYNGRATWDRSGKAP